MASLGSTKTRAFLRLLTSVGGSRTQDTLKLLPFIVMALVALIDFGSGPTSGLLPLLALGPAFASVACGLARTTVVGVIALALCVALGLYNDILWTPRTNITMVAILGVTVASVLASAGRLRHERQLADVRSVAEAAQRVLLRPVPRRAGPGIGVAVSYTSATAEARIGGDLYEVVTTPHGVRIIVGDVQGKGLEAVETAAVVLGAFREAAHDEAKLQGVVARLENALTRELSGEQFVTGILAEITGGTSITVINCGHPSPMVLGADGEHWFADPPDEALPLGMGSLKASEPVPHQIPFEPGDQVLFYTDGVIEARNGTGQFYPLPARAHLLNGADPQLALDALRADLLRHVGRPLGDDAAMLLLRHRAARPASSAA
ncbi:PP2C family protein-serine/threonine phosphatase [Streptosporangium roseum]|uniref:Serine phosphatase RsbU regulator of sigma subunit-like protein n=1 Tax=Streptosporangium roseum (strain ATCC 12428 / DSM 43021 / JCM 3005 / KCTC 9067 / NCIMB 10171 / NRRL 2505 / NI 9100) TaxID=479432 RepID=D2B6I8_STRRD|nr:PP2C family protein-serine/threonine phosphatase [Streptosporangium roseum]ACZ85752.1 Serine phosphatase RsbU regulator of sigma subunit-like protein [Streptosporangium roseum DSM 43021]